MSIAKQILATLQQIAADTKVIKECVNPPLSKKGVTTVVIDKPLDKILTEGVTADMMSGPLTGTGEPILPEVPKTRAQEVLERFKSRMGR